MNTTQEKAIKYLLEHKGYSIYEINTYETGIVIEGVSYIHRDYEFEVTIPTPIERDKGKSAIDMIVEKIGKYFKDIDDSVEELSEKKEFKKKESSNEVLIEMFENGIERVDSVRVSSVIIGRKQGKTSTIVYLAQKYNLPIVVSDNQYKELLHREDKELKVYNMKSVEGLNSDIVLVDELEIRHSLRLKEMGYIVIGIVR